MAEDEAKRWAKDKVNQNKVVDLFFKRGTPVKAKNAFFMAGIPGAGKTEFAENMVRAMPGVVSIEHDQLVTYIDEYRPQEYYNYRKAGSIWVTRILDECLQKGYSLIFDGTLSHEQGAKNVKRCLKAGYSVIIIYIVQNPARAWELTQARELIMKRSIERKGFIETCEKLNGNLLHIFEEHRANPKFGFWLLDKQNGESATSATAILYDSQSNSAEDIEKALKRRYSI